MRKIALPVRNGRIDGHFGHCEYFEVYTTDGERIVSRERVDSPEGCGCKSGIASTLRQMGVDTMLAGNMGAGAVNVLRSNGIETVRGCAGETAAVVADFIAGRLADSGGVCQGHGASGHGCPHD